ncbi:alpha-1,2-fucosyltransferase [Ammoniphilus sp. 3BR4]|uniref:alpha-1,2-fucosyltransferase n=1 Tax=Ammoniphilus sp. 3BR4 TaxID=3158265 RepID=UPI00346752F6
MKDRITMSALGPKGIGKGFGNKLFQYAFLKTYAKKHHLKVEVPKWIGRYLFGLKDPPITKKLPVVKQVSPCLEQDSIPNAKEPYKNVDLLGYFQYHTRYYAPYKNYIQALFQPVPDIQTRMDEAIKRLRSKGKTIVGLHLRRGDYGLYNKDPFFIPPNSWYLQWLNEIWNTLDDPLLFIASDETDLVLNDFSSYHPITSKDLEITLTKASFYPDFYILTQCDILAISNSTFSFSACLLNERSKSFMCPYPPEKSLVSFDPWDSEVLYRTDLYTKRYSFKERSVK